MRKDLMDILACPICKGPLELRATEERDDEVVEGELICHACPRTYPIRGSIPDLVP